MLSTGVISDVTVPDVVSVLNFLIFISFCFLFVFLDKKKLLFNSVSNEAGRLPRRRRRKKIEFQLSMTFLLSAPLQKSRPFKTSVF